MCAGVRVAYVRPGKQWTGCLIYMAMGLLCFYFAQRACRLFDLPSLWLLVVGGLPAFACTTALCLSITKLWPVQQGDAVHRGFVAAASIAVAASVLLSVGRPLQRCRFGWGLDNGACVSVNYFSYNARGDVVASPRARGLAIAGKAAAQVCFVECVTLDDPMVVQYQVGRLDQRRIYFETFIPVYAIVFSDPPGFPIDLAARDAAIAASAADYPETWDRTSAVRVTVKERAVQWPAPRP